MNTSTSTSTAAIATATATVPRKSKFCDDRTLIMIYKALALIVIAYIGYKVGPSTFAWLLSFEYVNSYYQMTKELILTLYEKNSHFQMLILSITTTVPSYFLYQIWPHIQRMFSKLLVWLELSCSLTLDNSDPYYDAIMDFLLEHVNSDDEGKMMSISQAHLKAKLKLPHIFHSGRKAADKKRKSSALGAGDDAGPEYTYTLASHGGLMDYTFEFGGRTIYLSVSENAPHFGSQSDRVLIYQSFTLTVYCLGFQNGDILKEILQIAIREKVINPQKEKLNIKTMNRAWGYRWYNACSKERRPADSVVLNGNILAEILDDITKFSSETEQKYYADKGIPYRRGYLLYGPPGCGKSSFAQVIASHFKLDLCLLSLDGDAINDDIISEALRTAPSNAIILLEDVDAVFVQRQSNRYGGCSFSGLLNAIDGVLAQEGRILIMTTNHREKLDPALIRPGRCDQQYEIKKASKDQMERMYYRFFKDYINQSIEPSSSSSSSFSNDVSSVVITHEYIQQNALLFATKIPEFEVSMAALQNFFLHFQSKEGIKKSIENIDRLWSPLVPDSPMIAIRDYLERVDLDKFASIFEDMGIYNSKYLQDMSKLNVKLEDLTEISVELKYDFHAQERVKKVLSGNELFIDKELKIVDPTMIRERFLNIFKTIPPYPYDATENENENLKFPNRSSSVNTIFNDSSYLKEKMDLVNLFCKLLSDNQPESCIISSYKLDSLLNSHKIDSWDKLRLHEQQKVIKNCVLHAEYYKKLKSTSIKMPQSDMTSEEFLRRAGLFHKINYFKSWACGEGPLTRFAKDLIEQNLIPALKDDNKANLMRTLNISRDEYETLSELVKSKTKPNIVLLRDFELPSLSTVKFEYMKYYASSFALHLHKPSDLASLTQIQTSSDHNYSCLEYAGYDFAIRCCKLHANPTDTLRLSDSNDSPISPSPSSSYSQSSSRIPFTAISRLSLLELRRFFRSHPDLNDAIRSIEDFICKPPVEELISDRNYDTAVDNSKDKSPLTAKSWVGHWLAAMTPATSTPAADEDDEDDACTKNEAASSQSSSSSSSLPSPMLKYEKAFNKQGFSSMNDLIYCNSLNHEMLKEIMKVELLGHRMKIIYWHEQLLRAKTLPPKMKE